jgi:hypothetical protein
MSIAEATAQALAVTVDNFIRAEANMSNMYFDMELLGAALPPVGRDPEPQAEVPKAKPTS